MEDVCFALLFRHDLKAAQLPGGHVGIFRGQMPRRVTFHALFASVVYFSCLGSVSIAATASAA